MNASPKNHDQRALRAVAAQYVINGVVVASYVPRLPEIRENLGIDLATIGQLITAASVAGLLGSWMCSHLVTRFGTKSLMIAGSLILILLLPCIALTSSVTGLILVLAAITFSDVIVDISVNMQGSVLSARRATPVINRLHGMWSIGTVAGGILAATMAAMALPLLWHLLLVSALLALGLWYIGGGLLSEDQHPQASDTAAGKATKPAPTGGRRLWLFSALGAAAFIPEMVLSDWSPFRLREDLGASEALSSFAYVAFCGGMVSGRMSADWITARFGRAQLLHLSSATAAVGVCLACFIDSLPVCYFGLGVAGLGVSALFPTLYDAAARDRGRPGAALGAMTAGSRCAMLLAPLTIGSLANSPSISVGVAIAAVAPPCLLLLWFFSDKVTGDTPVVRRSS